MQELRRISNLYQIISVRIGNHHDVYMDGYAVWQCVFFSPTVVSVEPFGSTLSRGSAHSPWRLLWLRWLLWCQRLAASIVSLEICYLVLVPRLTDLPAADWVSEFAPKSKSRFLSYIVGWLAALGVRSLACAPSGIHLHHHLCESKPYDQTSTSIGFG